MGYIRTSGRYSQLKVLQQQHICRTKEMPTESTRHAKDWYISKVHRIVLQYSAPIMCKN